ncbi:TetR/AcrR family transcriptional regulator [Paenibacillus oenotherae]|uniref:TetR/AcrR family transcriptional regulator n=1 Tax=Paenibacillus oenotherae TaxID=1435645 RepID=A0ABS7D3N8_9BACL|nr:TetR/AcrR family transcriptional regulator [Paenibacillus oenotherae]MBW7474545.1 TetR/AcrR family transcriptional regulator [Paenibacillus oenotherae]
MQQRNERRDAAEHRQLILQTASQLFVTHGVESVSMHQIAKSAGIGQGTLYRRYSSKADLCTELLQDSFRRFTEELDSYLMTAAHLPVQERLLELMSRWIDLSVEKLQWFHVIKAPTFCSVDEVKYYNIPPCLYLKAVLERLLQEAVDSAEIRPLNAEFTAFNIVTGINPEAFIHLIQERNYSGDQIKKHFLDHYRRTLFAGD